ncbi:MAG: transcriptional repressor LexA [Candidatus Omnitrophica bacterium]|nr:transcriptional repressor LexA [Candidatus Omnitrophota bacterium]
MAKQLTKRQHTVIEAIRTWIHERGYPPTIRELGKLLGIKSLRGVTTHLDAIAKKGFLKRESRARSIRLADLMAPFEQAVRIPVVGRIRAGEPMLAQEHVESHVVIDGAWLGVSTQTAGLQHFALKVRGDSMINAGIFDGDFVIVRQQATAENGEIIVALLGDESTVKRFFKDGSHIRLQPEHPTMEPILVGPDRPFSILGKVTAVFRQLS